jgi:cobalamin-dependent methionine synthase I
MNNDTITPRFRIVLGETRWIAAFKARPDVKFFNRIIRKKEGTLNNPIVSSMINETRSNSEMTIKPAAIYGFVHTHSAVKHLMPGADIMGVAVVTIGDGVELKADQNRQSGLITLSFLYEAWGSAFVEGIAAAVNAVMAKEALILGCTSGKRRSPGFGRWDFALQRLVMELLPAGRIHVSLTDSLTLVPRKSISFFIPLTPMPNNADY